MIITLNICKVNQVLYMFANCSHLANNLFTVLRRSVKNRHIAWRENVRCKLLIHNMELLQQFHLLLRLLRKCLFMLDFALGQVPV